MAAKSSAEDAVEDVTFRFFPMSEDMGIDAGRRADVCMAEALRDEFEVFASFEQHRRMRVPDGVEAETMAEMVAAILVDGAHVRLLESGAVLAPADAVAAIAVELAILQPVLRLLGVRGLENPDELLADGDGTEAGFALRHLLHGTVLQERLRDGDRARLEIDIVPRQREDFAAACARVVGDEDGQQDVRTALLEVCDELREFFRLEGSAFPERLSLWRLDAAHRRIPQILAEDGEVKRRDQDGTHEVDGGIAARLRLRVQERLHVARVDVRDDVFAELRQDVCVERVDIVPPRHRAETAKALLHPFVRELLVRHLHTMVDAARLRKVRQRRRACLFRFRLRPAADTFDTLARAPRADLDGVIPFLSALSEE